MDVGRGSTLCEEAGKAGETTAIAKLTNTTDDLKHPTVWVDCANKDRLRNPTYVSFPPPNLLKLHNTLAMLIDYQRASDSSFKCYSFPHSGMWPMTIVDAGGIARGLYIILVGRKSSATIELLRWYSRVVVNYTMIAGGRGRQ